MPKVSDVIENFILSTLGSSSNVNLSRNDLAQYFGCAPSQINYVLTTRFNLNRGFMIESQRGGGGYIRLVRINFDNNYIKHILDTRLNDEISFKDATYLLSDLCEKGFIKPIEASIITYAITDKALSNPIKIENKMRANIMKCCLINILKQKENSK